jgi:hypothetical protein
MRTLFVAAGGGGDVVGVLLARRILDPEPAGPALIATCAWERLRIDPLPGPRPIDGFSGLGNVGSRAIEVLPESDTVPPGRSTLPRVAADSGARIFLHDFVAGSHGLADQLRTTATALEAERLVVVDVGGDVLGTGDEPGLLSPLADSITLAAALQSGLQPELAIVGPGTDAELAEDDVARRLRQLGAHCAGSVDRGDVEAAGTLLAWHPTEASALVAGAATGVRGAVEMRRGGTPVPLSANSCAVWVIPSPTLPGFPLAAALANTTSLAEARQILRSLAVDEISYEEAKSATASRVSRPTRQTRAEAMSNAAWNGATHITARRLLELTGEKQGPRPLVGIIEIAAIENT